MLKVDQLSVMSIDSTVLLKDITLEVRKGKSLGLTGASGSGKTTLLKSVIGVNVNQLKVLRGRILLDDIPLNGMSTKARRKLCGTCIGYIPQNPMTAFNSRKRIGCQIIETLKLQLKCCKREAMDKFYEQLKLLNLEADCRLLCCYPQEISGGMLQRIALALVLSLEPDYLLADEPTSALDSVNKQLLIEALKAIKHRVGLLLVSHDAVVLEEICEEVLTLSHGEIVENGNMESVLDQSREIKEFLWMDC